MPDVLRAPRASEVTCIQDAYLCLPLCTRVSSVVCLDIQASQDRAGTFCLRTEPEQRTENLGIPLPFLTEESDGLILLIDFSLQSSGESGLIG